MGVQAERLYYANSQLREFTARVEEVREEDGKWLVRLNRTAFYPTSGGQPCDTGWLDEVRVVDVWTSGDHVWHTTERALQLGGAVTGRIDWERRFDHMQQHCGQHILSRVLQLQWGTQTVGFHLGEDVVTIDLDTAELSWETLLAAEWKANEIIWENLPVSAKFVDTDELAKLSLTKAPQVAEDIRIVSIGDFDHNPCGGTHPNATGEIGQIRILKSDRVRGGLRISFVCGGRALRHADAQGTTLQRLRIQLSTGVEELPNALEKLQQNVLHVRKTESALKAALADCVASQWAEEVLYLGTTWFLAKVLSESEKLADRKRLVEATAAQMPDTEGVIFLAVHEDTRLSVMLTSSHPQIHAGTILRSVLSQFGAKGGGSPQSAQGSIEIQGSVDILQVELLKAVQESVDRCLD